jgi:hypothetical protein
MLKFGLAYQRSGSRPRTYLVAGTSAGMEVEPQQVGFAMETASASMMLGTQEVGVVLDQQEMAMDDGTEV